MAKAAKIAAKEAKGASRGKVSEEVIDIPDPVPSLTMDDLTPSEKYRKLRRYLWNKREKS